MRADDMILISVDDHICEPADMFDGHVPEKYREFTPRVVTDEQGSQQWWYGEKKGRNLGLNAVAEISSALLDLRPMAPVIGVVAGEVGSYGGMSIAAALCTRLIITPQGRIGLNGPAVIEPEGGIDEFDSSDRALIWSIDGGEQRAATGLADKLVADNRDLAASSGIDVNRVILVVWMMGGALAALGGVLLGLSDQVQWDMGFRLLLLMFAGVTLGGLGTAYGALVGSLIVGVFVQMSTLVIPNDVKYVGGLLLLIVILVIRPQGILGSRARIG